MLIAFGILGIWGFRQNARNTLQSEAIADIYSLTGETVTYEGRENSTSSSYYGKHHYSSSNYDYYYDQDIGFLTNIISKRDIDYDLPDISFSSIETSADTLLQNNIGDMLPATAQKDAKEISGYSYLIQYFGQIDDMQIPYGDICYTNSGVLLFANFNDLSFLAINTLAQNDALTQEEAKTLAISYIESYLPTDPWPGTDFGISSQDSDWEFGKQATNGQFYWMIKVKLYRNGIAPEDRDPATDECTFDLRINLYTGELAGISRTL